MKQAETAKPVTYQSMRILNAFAVAPDRELSGADLLAAGTVSAGTLYPMLLRLEEAGLLKSRWTEVKRQIQGTPRRKVYQITGMGIRLVGSMRDEYLGGLIA